MRKRLGWKLILTILVVFLAIYLAFPLRDKIKLGLDLKGGIHLVLQVNTDDAINIETDERIARLQELFRRNNIEYKSVTKGQLGHFSIHVANPDQNEEIKDLLDEHFREWSATFVDNIISLSMKGDATAYLRSLSVNQAVETIRNRVDEFGVAEPIIQRQGIGGDRIIVELPGVDNPDRVKSIIKTTALLEWKLVKAGPAPDRETLVEEFGGTIPGEVEIVRGDAVKMEGAYYLVSRVAAVTGKDLKNAHSAVDEWNNPAVAFSLGPDGARRFKQVTSENIGKSLAIILDGTIQSAPVIEDIISDSGIIRGHFTLKEADDLALVLRAGALPASVKYLEERTIGPSLGADSIRKGLQASLIALFLVMFFMLAYYRSAGFNANAALFLNMLLLLGALSYFRATLTLPGIAGIILSIGMAVDANVLIFERIKEELALAKTIAKSISTGFSRAFSAILDSNVTTIISALFLFQFGTGPIKGYAVTLIIGLTASMFTAVFVSRLIFNLVISKRRGMEREKRFLKISFFKKTNINFMKYKYIAFALSAAFIIAGLVNVMAGKGLKYGVDFSGGTLIRIKFKSPVSIDEIRQSLKNVDIGSTSIQEVEQRKREYLIRTAQSSGETGQELGLEAHEIIGNRVVDALRGIEEKQVLEMGLKDLNSITEGDLIVLLSSSFPDQANAIGHKVVTFRTSEGIIEDYSQLKQEGVSQDVLSFLKEKTFLGNLTVLSKETVGPQVGQTLKKKAAQATLWALVGMLVYIAFRFKLAYGVSAILTLTHDVLVTLSVFSFTHREINLPVIAAILTIVGFSLNDTIVIFDRVRDLHKTMRKSSLEEILNASVNQTLSRSIITSGTVFLTVIALYFLGGEVINDFAFTMLVGVISGSYSTIYQSCPIVFFWQKIFKPKGVFSR
jgi:preprotein translocase subunit SecD